MRYLETSDEALVLCNKHSTRWESSPTDVLPPMSTIHPGTLSSCTATQPSATPADTAQSPLWCCQVCWGPCQGAPATDEVSRPHASQPCNVWGHEQPFPSLMGAPLVPKQLLDPLLFPGSNKVRRHLVLHLSRTWLWGGRRQRLSHPTWQEHPFSVCVQGANSSSNISRRCRQLFQITLQLRSIQKLSEPFTYLDMNKATITSLALLYFYPLFFLVSRESKQGIHLKLALMPAPCQELGHNRRNVLTAGQRFFAVTADCESGHELGTPQAHCLGQRLLIGDPHYQHLENKSSDTGRHYCFTDRKSWHQDVTKMSLLHSRSSVTFRTVKLSGVSVAFTIPLFP